MSENISLTSPSSVVYNADCLEYMRTLPDNAFDIAICDPPYGIGADKNQIQKVKSNKIQGHSKALWRDYGDAIWDSEAPEQAFFDEVRRVSRNQIIWGANHFISRIPLDSSCWVVWDKDNGTSDFADCELAWTSFPSAVRRFKYRWAGMLQENMANKEERIHPTQKPVALYGWLLQTYAKVGDKIFDPMMGSGSSRIAAYKLGFDFVGCERDKGFFDKSQERFERECKGVYRLPNGRTVKEQSLF